MNWIIPNRFIAFMGPDDSINPQRQSIRLWDANDYANFFKNKLNMGAVFRLNKNTTYNNDKFKNVGIDHYDMQFPDGHPPEERILNRFLDVAEKYKQPMGVHCKAGLGRTGCCIAGQAIKHFRFPARWFIGYIRIRRPGSILGPQQQWMLQEEEKLIKLGESWRKSGKKINIDQSWLENGDSEFIQELISGKFDKSEVNVSKNSNNADDLSNSLKKMKLNENSSIEEQGNRLVDSKAKSPSMSPKKIVDAKFRSNNNYNQAEGLKSNLSNAYGNMSPNKNVKMNNIKNF